MRQEARVEPAAPRSADDGRPSDDGSPLILLLGPTASGKSAVAMALARQFPIEIVSVDSALVYRGMDLGTAKPEAADRAAVPHHLLDLIDPSEAYSAARFVDDARAAIDAIRQRARLPLLVGGTMLYARALIDGLHALPRADPQIRRTIDEDARRLGWPAMHARLTDVDPVTAARLPPTDAQRIQRALEIHAATGEPMSSWLQRDTRRADATHHLVIALEPSDRSRLHQRIAARLRSMLDAGFVDEVRALRARGDLHPDLPSMRCVGYRQIWQWLDDGGKPGKHWDDTEAACVAATRQLAKRQLTWLRGMPQRQIVDCLAPDVETRVATLVAGSSQAARRKP